MRLLPSIQAITFKVVAYVRWGIDVTHEFLGLGLKQFLGSLLNEGPKLSGDHRIKRGPSLGGEVDLTDEGLDVEFQIPRFQVGKVLKLSKMKL